MMRFMRLFLTLRPRSADREPGFSEPTSNAVRTSAAERLRYAELGEPHCLWSTTPGEERIPASA